MLKRPESVGMGRIARASGLGSLSPVLQRWAFVDRTQPTLLLNLHSAVACALQLCTRTTAGRRLKAVTPYSGGLSTVIEPVTAFTDGPCLASSST